MIAAQAGDILPPHPEERLKGASRRMQAAWIRASWFETRFCATLLTMRV